MFNVKNTNKKTSFCEFYNIICFYTTICYILIASIIHKASQKEALAGIVFIRLFDSKLDTFQNTGSIFIG